MKDGDGNPPLEGLFLRKARTYTVLLDPDERLELIVDLLEGLPEEHLARLAAALVTPEPAPLAAGRNAAFVMNDGKLTLRVTKPRPDPVEKPLTDLK